MMEDVATPQHLTPLVGRTRELDQLTTAAGIGTDPVSAAVVLGGDAGVGKTRLLSELAERARTVGWTVLVGHCLDFGDGSLAYLPFTELFSRLAGEQPALAEALTGAHPAIQRLQPGRRVRGGTSGEHQEGDRGGGPGREGDADGLGRGEVFEAVHGALRDLGAEAPLLVIIEDAHWADRSTRDLLSFLFGRGFATPVTVVVSYRSDDLHRRHPMRGTVTEWGRAPSVQRLNLGVLPDPAVRALVQSVHGREVPQSPLDEDRVHEIVHRAEGNAFFAEELLVASALGRGALPADLADLLLLRLDQLDEPTQTMVRAASVAGRRVRHDLLAGVVDPGGAALDAALRSAVEANVLVADGPSYAFRHALLAEAVYDDLLPGERQRWHQAYVAALSGAGLGAAAELARHARAANDLETALSAGVEAGEEAMRVGGPDEAARHFQAALELLEDPDLARTSGIDRVRLTVRAGEALMDSGQSNRAGALLRRALGTGDPPAVGDDRSRLLLGLARSVLFTEDTDPTPVDLTSEALELIGPTPRPLRAAALAVHARALIQVDRLADAGAVAQAAVDLADLLERPATAVDAATTLARLPEFLGDPTSSVEALRSVVRRARERGEPTAVLRGLHQLGGALLETGDVTGARAAYDDAVSLAREVGRTWSPYACDARLLGALCAYIVGDWGAAEQATDTTGEAAPPVPRALLRALATLVAAGRGDPGAPELVEASRVMWETDGWVAVLAGGAAIEVSGDRQDVDEAERIHDEVVSGVQRMWGVEWFPAQVRLAALLLGQVARHVATRTPRQRDTAVARATALADATLERMTERDESDRPMGPEGRAWRDRLVAELLRLRWLAGVDAPQGPELRSAWEQSVASFGQLGHSFETARSRARLAAVLRTQGDLGAAGEQTALAREVGEQLGALPLLAEVSWQQPAGGAGGPAGGPDPDLPTPAELTPREHEVLSLVARGRTNGQIGSQLFISTKTVSVHVSNILAKLGATGRTEAAALAREAGLLR